ncbi:MAG: hypothetical protein ABFD29_03920 [Anaerolineaceae bacterium]
MKKQFVILILTTILVGLIASACNTAQQVSPTGVSTLAAETSPTADTATSTRALDGQALALERCTACHSYTNVQNTKASPAGWERIVNQMIAKGAVLNQEEAAAVMDYLAKTYPQ